MKGALRMLNAHQLAFLLSIEQGQVSHTDVMAMRQLHQMIDCTTDAAELARIEAAADHLASQLLADMDRQLGELGLDLDDWVSANTQPSHSGHG
jgi:hypothetical protein